MLHRERVVARQTLAFTLWPDVPEDVARANLRRHLHHLKRALPPAVDGRPWLLTDAQTVRWNPRGDYWLDVAEFERLSANPATVAQAVELYKDDLLADQYDDWLFYHRERLRSLYFADLDHLIRHHRARRDYPTAIAYSTSLLAHDPLREDALRLLVALRYEAGDRAGALHEYDLFLTHLRAELGVDPMPETIALYEAILRNRALPGLTRTGKNAPPPAAKQPLHILPFVGRESELRTINDWWTRAAHGQGRLLLIGGEAGVGKTRLMEEFTRLAQDQGGRVLWGSAHAVEATPYQAVMRALRSALPMLAALEIEPLWLAAVAELIPEIRSRRLGADMPLPMLPPLDPDRARDRLFAGIAHCLEGLAQPRPLVLALDDLHWSGAGTAGLLEFLSRRLPRQRLLILAAYRQEETFSAHPLRGLRRRLRTDNLITHLSLGRMGSRTVQNLVAEISGLGEDATTLAGQLYTASEGNPFFLLELIRDRMEAGDIRVEGGRWHVQTQVSPIVPTNVRDTIAGRAGRLDKTSGVVAEVAAVIGPAFDIDMLCEVSGWDESKVLDALDVLMDYHLVREAAGGGSFDYAFTHHLIQATLYENIPAHRRQRRHRRVAHVIAGLNPGRVDDLAAALALHFDRGGEPEQAAAAYLRAARRALQVTADEEALAALGRGLKLASDPHLRFDLLALQEDIHHRRGERAAQETGLTELAALARGLREDDRACDLLCRQIRFRRVLGDREAEGKLVAALKQRAVATDQVAWQVQALQSEATHHLLLSRYDSSHALLEEALSLYRSTNDIRGEVTCLCLLAEIAVHQARFERAGDLLKQANTLVEAQGDQALLIKTLKTAARAAFMHRDFDTSRTLADQMLALCRTIGDREGEAGAHARLGATLARQFQVSPALDHYEKAAALYADLNKRQGQAAVLLNRGMLANTLGRYAEAMNSIQQANTLFTAMHDRRGMASCAINLSAVAIYQEDHSLAEEYAHTARSLAREIQIPLFEAAALGNLGDAELKLGKLDQAIAHLHEALDLRRQQHLSPTDSATDFAILAIACLRAGETNQARRVTDELLELYAAKGDTIYDPQLVLWAAAQTYRALGQRQRSGELLARACAILQERATAIPDPESRAAFLSLPFNRQLLDAHENGRWP
ncbi:MAG: AAA family ATPase [Chloroflexi bacterium]|nr:AAA family ATPase [Chloroflexota bacterium]